MLKPLPSPRRTSTNPAQQMLGQEIEVSIAVQVRQENDLADLTDGQR